MTTLLDLELNNLIKKLEININLNKISINKLIIKIIISENISNNDTCFAIVNNLKGKNYRCTRKRKFGHFCGLHNCRKNNFLTIIPKNNKFIKYYLNLKNNLYQNIDTNDMYTVKYDYLYYKVNSTNGNIYLTYGKTDWYLVDNINISEIPYTII